MFNNLFNRHDLPRFFYGLRHGYLRTMISRFTKGRTKRVEDAWTGNRRTKATTWWMIPAIKKRNNYLMTGDENIDYFHYIAEKYLSEKQGMTAMSIGCGNGHRERIWACLADFNKITGYDISQDRITSAVDNAERAGLSNNLEYRRADIAELELPPDQFDVIFIEMALHHFSPLEEILIKISRWLRPNGFFVINEFVGPSRFQWKKRQLEIANGVLSILPPKYRKHVIHGNQIKKIVRPSRFSMIMKDPSESIESERIMPLLKKHFIVVEERPYYGTITHPLFDGIAENFIPDDKDTQCFYDLCLKIEEALILAGDIESDFTLAVFKK